MRISNLNILELLKKGDERAYRKLYDRHYSLLCNIAYSFVKDDYVAENIVSDLMFHIYEIRAELNITGSLRSYLVKAVRNRCLNYLESNKNRKEIRFSELEDADDWLFAEPDPEEPLGLLLEKELELEIEPAIGRLPEECRKVFRMSRFEQKTYQEIATELNISVNTVKYHIKNALAILREDFKDYL
ncbi:MAG: RNA polymerase sigma-70 factor [Tannerella sp.]|jgi:RNA polymerase sigma-70 factor (ECF subfamily)|nr:RNA polymerase sigma-70 factor [Tannerella sp.]